ncbi:DUF5011 domain-containing protein [Listeria monocytogenes]|nr:DUF5011 domain-containing protein [Listeria monocytogenes]
MFTKKIIIVPIITILTIFSSFTLAAEVNNSSETINEVTTEESSEETNSNSQAESIKKEEEAKDSTENKTEEIKKEEVTKEPSINKEVQKKTVKTTSTIKNETPNPDDIVDISLYENQRWLIDFTNNATKKSISQTTYADVAKIKTMSTNVTYFNSIIPKAIGLYTGLESIELNYDKNLSGNIPDEIGNLTNLTNLSLMGNTLNGTIPDSIGNLTKLKTLNLSANAINSTYNGYREGGLGGDIPASIGNLTELTSLSLGDYNNFTSIPSTIGNLTKLQTLKMNQTLLSSVPKEIKNLTNLTTLDLSYNTINQEIPQEWDSLTNLTNLDLACNAFYGEVPEWTYDVATLNLSKNILFDVPEGKGMGTSPTFNYLNAEKAENATVKNNQYDVTANYENCSLADGVTTFDVRDNLICVYQTTKAIYFPKKYAQTESTLVSGDPTGISFDGNNATIKKSGTYTINVEMKGLKDKSNMNAQASYTITADLPNQAPVIEVPDDSITVNQGTAFDYHNYVSITDDSDTNIEENLQVSGLVDVSTPGDYTLTFNATDSEGLNAETKVLHVHVNGIPVIIADDQIVTKGDSFDPMSIVTVTDEDTDIMDKIIVSSEEITPTLYHVTYTVKDSNGAEANKTIQVTVIIPKTPETPVLPVNPLPSPLPPKNDPKISNTNPTSNITINVSKTKATLPKTGDKTNQSVPILFGLIALSAAAILLRRK